MATTPDPRVAFPAGAKFFRRRRRRLSTLPRRCGGPTCGGRYGLSSIPPTVPLPRPNTRHLLCNRSPAPRIAVISVTLALLRQSPPSYIHPLAADLLAT